MSKSSLNQEELALAYELANIYYWMDKDCHRVSEIDKQRLYSAAANNKDIHFKAREINKAIRKKLRKDKIRGVR